MKKVATAFVFVALLATVLPAQEVEPPRIDVSVNRYQFVPNEVTLRRGVTVTLRLTSDERIHRLRSRDLRIDVDLRPNQPHDVTITPERTGRFELTSADAGGAEGGGKLAIDVTP